MSTPVSFSNESDNDRISSSERDLIQYEKEQDIDAWIEDARERIADSLYADVDRAMADFDHDLEGLETALGQSKSQIMRQILKDVMGSI